MAQSLIGLASIPICVTKKPKNLLKHIPDAHFRGLSFMPYVHNSSKVSYGCSV